LTRQRRGRTKKTTAWPKAEINLVGILSQILDKREYDFVMNEIKPASEED